MVRVLLGLPLEGLGCLPQTQRARRCNGRLLARRVLVSAATYCEGPGVRIVRAAVLANFHVNAQQPNNHRLVALNHRVRMWERMRL
eukprot:1688132-Amphidinium_carterae.1